MSFDLPRRYPLLLPVLGIAVGIYAAVYGASLAPAAMAILAISAILAAWRWPKTRRPAVLFLAFLLGLWRAAPLFPREIPSPLKAWVVEKRTVTSVFRVEDYPRCAARHCSGSIRLLGWEEEGVFRPLPETGLSLRVWQSTADWIPGEIYRADLKYSAPRRFKNRHSFDYPEYLRRQGTAALASASSPLGRLGTAPAWQVHAAAFRRSRLLWLRQNLAPGPGRAVLEAFLFGEETGLDERTDEVFRRTGLTHVLVVSGLHFVFLSFCFYWPLSCLLSLSSKLSQGGAAQFLAFFLAAIPTFFYGLVVGLSPSVLRSLASSAVVIFALAGGWRRNFLSSLLLVLGIFLLARPALLFSVSFQLSFASVAALSLLGKAWRSESKQVFDSAWRRFGRRIAVATGSAVGVNLVLAPWLAGDFHEFSLVAPLSNLIFVPFFSIALPFGLAIALFGISENWIAIVALQYLHRGIEGVFWLLGKLADQPWSSYLVAPWSYLEWLAYFFVLAALLKPRPWLRSAAAVFLAALLLLGGEAGRNLKPPSGRLSLTMFDVGQGESLLLELPEGQAVLIDGGGFPGSSFDVGRNILMPELLARGRRRLDAIALSHPDADHAKGLRYLVDRLAPREFWLSPGTEFHPDFAILGSWLRRREVPLRRMIQGEAWSFGGAAFEVLWPPLKVEGLSDNNASLVLRVCYGAHCFLLTGDLESEVEGQLTPGARGASVLKVAHHGSKSSTSLGFLTAWKPQVALISAGEGNRYRLPNKEVLGSLEKRGIVILRSDRDGQVRVNSDGKRLDWERFRESPIPSRWFAIRAAVSGSGS